LNNPEQEIRQDKIIMRECVNGLGVYAALVSMDRHNSSEADKIRGLIANIVPYWGLDEGVNAKPLEDFLQEFDDMVDNARHGRGFDPDTFTACSDALTGLAQHGQDLVNSQGKDAMSEILQAGDVMNETAEYFGYTQEMTFASDSARQFNNSVKAMLKEYDLPGSAIEGETNANYAVKQAVLFDNNVGFAFAHNPEAASPFVTWRTYNDGGKLSYEWGNYFNNEEKALVDYITRHKMYEAANKVKEVTLPMAAEPEQDEQRAYKAEISMPNEKFPRLEVFGADNDVDAVEKANGLCDDVEGSYLLKVHELNEEYDSIRQIDLRYHDPEARRFMDVDIIGFLGQIAEKTIVHYPNDFNIDKEALWKKAISENPASDRFMWHCCSYGTHILPEDEVFTRSTGAYGYWVDYRPNEPDMVGYAVEVTGYKDETVVGNVYDMGNYYSHAQYVRETASVLDAVSLTYSNSWGINAGKTITVPRYEYDNDRHRLMSESGNVTGIKYHPSESIRTMAGLLQAEKAKHMAMPIGSIQEHLESLDKKLADIRGLPLPAKKDELKIYHADFHDPEIPERMEIIVAKDDAEAMRQAYDFCKEAEGITLLELNEVGRDGDARELDIDEPPVELLPDPTITTADRDAYGYDYKDMLPLNRDRALELHNQDRAIYLLYKDNTESMVDNPSEIIEHDGIFGIESDDWHRIKNYEPTEKAAGHENNNHASVSTKQAETTDEKATSQITPAVNEKPEKSEKPLKPKKPYRGEDR